MKILKLIAFFLIFIYKAFCNPDNGLKIDFSELENSNFGWALELKYIADYPVKPDSILIDSILIKTRYGSGYILNTTPLYYVQNGIFERGLIVTSFTELNILQFGKSSYDSISICYHPNMFDCKTIYIGSHEKAVTRYPLIGESVSYFSNKIYAIDKSPSIGTENSRFGATVPVYGQFLNEKNSPIVKMEFTNDEGIYFKTDSLGKFVIDVLPSTYNLVSLNGFYEVEKNIYRLIRANLIPITFTIREGDSVNVTLKLSEPLIYINKIRETSPTNQIEITVHKSNIYLTNLRKNKENVLINIKNLQGKEILRKNIFENNTNLDLPTNLKGTYAINIFVENKLYKTFLFMTM